MNEYKTLKDIVSQLEMSEYQCIGGYLKNNTAFIRLKELADQVSVPLDLFVKPTFAKIPLRLMYKVLDKYLTHDLHTPYGQMFNHWEQLIEHLREDLASYENYGIIDDVNDK